MHSNQTTNEEVIANQSFNALSPRSLNMHAYIGLYLTHACQKYFWKGMHVPQFMAKRGKLKKVKKKKMF